MPGPVLGTGERKRGVYCPNLTVPWRKRFPEHTQFMHTRLCVCSWSEPGSLGRQREVVTAHNIALGEEQTVQLSFWSSFCITCKAHCLVERNTGPEDFITS